MDEVSEVKAKLLAGCFTTEQLQMLRAVIDLKLGNIRAEVKVEVEEVEAEHFVSLLYTELASLVQRYLGQRVPHLGMLKRVSPRVFKEVAEAASALKRFLNEVVPRCGRPQQISFLRMYFDLAYGRCMEEGGVITTQRLMRKHEEVGALFDAAFPGYIRGGMLRVILYGSDSLK